MREAEDKPTRWAFAASNDFFNPRAQNLRPDR